MNSSAYLTPTGGRGCTPTGGQHLESLEKEIKTSSPGGEGLFDSLREERNEPQPCADATRNAPRNGKPRATAASLDELQKQWFEQEFWPHIWRKVDKADALRAFKKHASSVDAKNRIVAALKAHAPVYLCRNPEHRPHAATWLNKRRYEEPPEDTRPANGHGSVSTRVVAQAAELPNAEDYLRAKGIM